MIQDCNEMKDIFIVFYRRTKRILGRFEGKTSLFYKSFIDSKLMLGLY